MDDIGPYTKVGREADHEIVLVGECDLECSGKKKAILIISDGSTCTILRSPEELCLINQRCLAGLKSMLCGEASAIPFCRHLSGDLIPGPLSFFPASAKS